jgi:hypothetical protein
MIFNILHLLACLVLIGACLVWKFRRPVRGDAHRFLFPFILAVIITAAIRFLLPTTLELFAAYYSGALYAVTPLTGYFRWFTLLMTTVTFLPAVGIFRVYGSSAATMAIVSFIALLPDLYPLFITYQ